MRVISFALWGTNPMYSKGAIENSIIAKEIYPGWECWFYVDKNSISQDIINTLIANGSKVFSMKLETPVSSQGMFWRMFPVANIIVKYVISRDCDSRLDYREKACVDEWIESGKSFHCIRDHPHHNIEILGGMWGCKYPKLTKIYELFEEWKRKKKVFQSTAIWKITLNKGDDQRFLREMVWPLVKDDVICHDERFNYPGNKPFPKHQPNKYCAFTGEIINV